MLKVLDNSGSRGKGGLKILKNSKRHLWAKGSDGLLEFFFHTSPEVLFQGSPAL